MEEIEIVHTALDHLETALLKGEWHPFNNAEKGVDGEFILIYENQRIHFDAIVKKELRTYQIEQIIDQAHRIQNPTVIANSLYPALKEKLKAHRIH